MAMVTIATVAIVYNTLPIAGARTNIRNKENQLPYDLSAKNPEVGRQLMVRGESLNRAHTHTYSN